MATTAELLRTFRHRGFEGLVDREPCDLADHLEQNAAHTGLSAPLFVALAIRAVYALLVEHDEAGGIRTGFVHTIDALVGERIPLIEQADPHWAAKLAKDFRDDTLALVNAYDPDNEYV